MKTREQFIDENASLFWYIQKDKLHSISDEVLVEFILNYADLPQINTLLKIIGEKKVAEIVNKNIQKVKQHKRQNYRFFFSFKKGCSLAIRNYYPLVARRPCLCDRGG